MAKLNLNCMLEAFILAAGVPPSLWRTPADETSKTAQTETRNERCDAESQNTNAWGTPVSGHYSGRKSA
jgi:hypothetical protein